MKISRIQKMKVFLESYPDEKFTMQDYILAENGKTLFDPLGLLPQACPEDWEYKLNDNLVLEVLPKFKLKDAPRHLSDQAEIYFGMPSRTFWGVFGEQSFTRQEVIKRLDLILYVEGL